MNSFVEHLKPYIGEKVVFICARYQYWGILSEVGEHSIILADAVSVEQSGSASAEEPNVADPVHRSVIIKSDAIELMYQPRWCFNKLPNEDEE